LPQALSESDLELIEAAREVIRRNYDAVRENHTVGSAVRCSSGRVYVGVNIYSLHGSCAEFIAIGSAITAGEREFVTIASVRGADGAELPAPCGNCRQMLSDYSPDCDVILETDSGPAKVKVSALLPYSYHVE
jgi:cytidine deaminase